MLEPVVAAMLAKRKPMSQPGSNLAQEVGGKVTGAEAGALMSFLASKILGQYDLAPDALVGSVFRMLRQGQRVIFDVDDRACATRLRLGSEVDMGTPGFGGIPEIPAQTD